MAKQINKDGKFQSDKYPDLPPDKFLLSFKDPVARKSIKLYAELTEDKELSKSLLQRLKTIKF